MKIEQIVLSNEEVVLVSPPAFCALPLFEKLFHIFCCYINQWQKEYSDIKTQIELSGVVKKQISSFLDFAFKRSPLSIDSVKTLEDYVKIKNAFYKVNQLDQLPNFREKRTNKVNEFVPEIKETTDSYNNYIGDLVAKLESTGLTLCQNYDLNSIRQILYRVEQHKYWSNSENIEKAQRQKDIDVYGDMIYELFDD